MQAIDSRDDCHFENTTDSADAPSGSEKSESICKSLDDEKSSTDSEEGPETQLPSIDDQIERVGFGRFHKRCLLLLCFIMASRGTEYVLFYILKPNLVAQWSLDTKVYDIHTWISFGCLCIGMVLGGVLADKYGRHVVLLVSAIGVSISTLCRAVSPDWYMFCAMHFGNEVLAGCEFPIVLTLAHEFFPRKWRSESVVLILGSGLFLGVLFVSIINNFIAFAFDSSMPNNWWRFIVAVSVVPHLLSTAILWSDTPESPRWLLTKGRKQMCTSLLKLIAEENYAASRLLANGEVRVQRVVNFENSLLEALGSLSILRVWIISTTCMAASFLISLLSSLYSLDSIYFFGYKQSLLPILQPFVIALSIFLNGVVGLRSSTMIAYGMAAFFSLVTTMFSSTVLKDALYQLHLCCLLVSGYQALVLAVASFPTAFRSTLIGLSCSFVLVSAGVACGLVTRTSFSISPIGFAVIALLEASMSALILYVPEETWTKASEKWPD